MRERGRGDEGESEPAVASDARRVASSLPPLMPGQHFLRGRLWTPWAEESKVTDQRAGTSGPAGGDRGQRRKGGHGGGRGRTEGGWGRF